MAGRGIWPHLSMALLGTALGFAISRIGFADFGQVHAMFLFADLRMFLTFVGALALVAAGLLVVARGSRLPTRAIHKGTAIGGVLFGLGWAVTGVCPGAALVQLGEGQLPALWTIGGIFLGTWLYGKVHERFFGWHIGACDE